MKKLVIHPKLCIGCKACEIACAREHNGVSNIWIYVIDEARISIPYTCLHCVNPPCITKCSAGALRKSSEIVLLDHSKCTKCLECVKTCPYNAIKVFDKPGLITKCDLCYHRLSRNLLPACVSTCPTGAIAYIEAGSENPVREVMVVKKNLLNSRHLGPCNNTGKSIREISLNNTV